MKKPKEKAPKKEINLSLVENGLDFIESSLRHILKRSDQRNIKYAILHLLSGVLLLLKERVRREHWALLFANPDKANKEKFQQGDFNSVNFDQLLSLIKDVCGIKIDVDAGRALTRLRNERNRAEHFEFRANPIALKATAGQVLDFLVDFIHDELEPSSFSDSETKFFEKIKGKLPEFEKFVMARENRLKTKLNAYEGTVLRCTSCDYRNLIRDNDGDVYQCLFCHEKYDNFEQLANDYLEDVHGISSYVTVKDGGEWPQHECLECGQECMVPKEPSYESGYICIACDAHYALPDVDTCSSCGVLMPSGSSVCNGCFKHATRD